jgi:hypothetical protein
MSKIVRQFIDGEIEVLTGDDAHEFATHVQMTSLQTSIGFISINAAIADQNLRNSDDVMDVIDQTFSPNN